MQPIKDTRVGFLFRHWTLRSECPILDETDRLRKRRHGDDWSDEVTSELCR